MVQVVRMISIDEMHSENIRFSWSKSSNYQEKLRCHACDIRTHGGGGKWKIGQFSVRPEPTKNVTCSSIFHQLNKMALQKGPVLTFVLQVSLFVLFLHLFGFELINKYKDRQVSLKALSKIFKSSENLCGNPFSKMLFFRKPSKKSL